VSRKIGGRIDHESRCRRRTSDDVNYDFDENTLVYKVAAEGQNAVDIKMLQSLLHEELTERMREKTLESLEWLRGHPRRTLPKGRRELYASVRRAIELRAAGRYQEPTPEQRAARQKAYVLRQARYLESRRELPTWMLDPSQLPKKPPGR
jgi:hypothetical protein